MDNERQDFCDGNDEKHRETIMCDRILKETSLVRHQRRQENGENN